MEAAGTRVSFLYPNECGKAFDYAYYANKHMPLVQRRMAPFGLLRYEVDRAAVDDAPFIAACHLYFNAAEEFRKAIAKHVQAQMQISEIVM